MSLGRETFSVGQVDLRTGADGLRITSPNKSKDQRHRLFGIFSRLPLGA
jgi:hypothetical protein